MGPRPSLAPGNSPTNYDFAFAHGQALKLVAGQLAISGIVALIFAASSGAPAALAALAGGGIGAMASLVQVACSFRRRASGNAPAIARGFYRGEAMKVGVTVLLFVLALRGRTLMPGPLLAGYAATFVAYWVALVRFSGARRR